MNRVLRYSIIGGLFAILFIPFTVANPLFFPFITGKGFAFRIIVEIIFALWVILALHDPRVRPKKSLLLYTVLGLVAALALSDALGENPAKSFWSNFERMEGLISFIHLAMYFIVVSTMLQGEKIWRAFWNTQIGASVLMALYACLQLAGVIVINQGGVRVDGTFGNATYLAVYMLFSFFLTLRALSSWKPGKLSQVWYGVALVLQATMIFYAATRGTILGTLGGLLLMGLIFIVFAKGQQRLRRWGAVLAVVIALVVGGFSLIKDTSFVRNHEILTRLASISLQDGATRFSVWRMAGKGIAERPILGWGQENFNYVFNTYYEPSMFGQEPWFDRAHNQFLDMAIAGGIVALALYLALFGLTLWYLWKPGSQFVLLERAVLTGLIAGYAFHNLFVFDNLMSYVLFLSLLAFVVSRHSVDTETIGARVELTPIMRQGASALILIVLLAGLWYLNVPGLARAGNLIQGLRPHGNDLSENLRYFKLANQGSGIGVQEAHEQLLQFTSQVQNPNLASLSTPELRIEILAYTVEEFDREITRAPKDARLRVFYGSFLRQMGDTERAMVHLDQALELSPRKQTIMFERGLLATQVGDAATALEVFQKAYELDHNFDQARLYYAATLIRVGERARADVLLSEKFGTALPDNDIILQAYLDVRDYSQVITILSSRAAAHPDDYNAYVQLGAGYLQAGLRVEAVAALRRAIELNADFKTQGEYYISEIEAGRNP